MHERFRHKQEKDYKSQDTFRCFELQYPYLAEKTVEWYDMGYFVYIAVLSNGEAYEYDNMNETVLQLKTLDEFGYEEGDDEYYKRNFGRKLDKMLRKRGMRQNALAEACGVSQGTISNYIRGACEPNYFMLIKIAKALRCSLDELV